MVALNSQTPAKRLYGEASDECLLLWYRDERDSRAFKTIVERYEKPLASFLTRLLHNASSAEETVQTTFLRVHEKCRQFSQGRAVRPWIYSIATNLAIDRLRKERHQQLASLDQPQWENETHPARLLNLLNSRVPQPVDQLQSQEDAAWVHQAIDSLPEHLRTTVLLMYFQGLKMREVAEALHVPLGTVKSRLHRALETLSAAWRKSRPCAAAN
jgi:RNA polymerase sigma-70 factor (ECF subfamily)